MDPLLHTVTSHVHEGGDEKLVESVVEWGGEGECGGEWGGEGECSGVGRGIASKGEM